MQVWLILHKCQLFMFYTEFFDKLTPQQTCTDDIYRVSSRLCHWACRHSSCLQSGPSCWIRQEGCCGYTPQIQPQMHLLLSPNKHNKHCWFTKQNLCIVLPGNIFSTSLILACWISVLHNYVCINVVILPLFIPQIKVNTIILCLMCRYSPGICVTCSEIELLP